MIRGFQSSLKRVPSEAPQSLFINLPYSMLYVACYLFKGDILQMGEITVMYQVSGGINPN